MPSSPARPLGPTAADGDLLLSVEGLTVDFGTADAPIHAVRGVSFSVAAGEVVALVGESGSGKTVSALATLGLLPSTARIAMDVGTLAGHDLTRVDEERLRALRGATAGMIFQDPLSSLNPVKRVGEQIVEAIRLHAPVSAASAKATAIDRLAQVGIPDPAKRFDEYPHQFSGGMRQRAMIAMALAADPPMLIADEPTTALDVTVQAQILELIQSLQRDLRMGVLLITHDLGVVSRVADRVVVMYAGRIVETGPTAEILRDPSHHYTAGLLTSLPRLDLPGGGRPRPIEGTPPLPDEVVPGCAFAPRCRAATEACARRPPLASVPGVTPAGAEVACHHPLAGATRPAPAASGTVEPDVPAPAADEQAAAGEPVLRTSDLQVTFSRRNGLFGATSSVHAVAGVDLDLRQGATLGLVGESGCGKTTLGRAILQLTRPTGGTVTVAGEEVSALGDKALRPVRRRLQIVFQDPQASLTPRHRIERILSEPLELHGLVRTDAERQARVEELLALVGLTPAFARRLPHELSGGQRQRVGIARALAVEPDVIVLDESVSALDVSIQAQVLALLERLQRDLGVAYLFISHDLAVIRHIADEVAVMYLGRIVEQGPAEEVYRAPRHPYTAALLSAVPVPDTERERTRERIVLRGDPPSPSDPPGGCPFHTRCWLRERLGDPEACTASRPELRATTGGAHRAACHFTDEQAAHLPDGAMIAMAEDAS